VAFKKDRGEGKTPLVVDRGKERGSITSLMGEGAAVDHGRRKKEKQGSAVVRARR